MLSEHKPEVLRAVEASDFPVREVLAQLEIPRSHKMGLINGLCRCGRPSNEDTWHEGCARASHLADSRPYAAGLRPWQG